MLTRGAIQRIYCNETEGLQAIVQLVDMKLIKAANRPDRYRVSLSDGEWSVTAMLSQQISARASAGEFGAFSVIRLTETMANDVNQGRVVIVVQADVVDNNVNRVIGNPRSIDEAVKRGEMPRPPPIQPRPVASVVGIPPGGVPPPQHFPPQQQQHPPPHAGAPGSAWQQGPGPGAAPAQPPAAYGRGGPAPAPHYQQQQQHGGFGRGGPGGPGMGQGPGGGGGGGHLVHPGAENLHPISALNPYNTRWTIKVRVTQKGDMREYKNERGAGRLFSVDLLDKEGSEIRATMFKETADKLYNLFQPGQVYTISKGQIKTANPRWNKTGCPYELTLNEDSEVQHVPDDPSIRKLKVNFVPIDAIKGLEKDATVDVLGVAVRSPGGMVNFTSKAGKELKKRTVTLLDRSLATIDVTFWGDSAERITDAELEAKPLLVVKGATVSDFGGHSLNAGFNSAWHLNPEMPEAYELKQWFDSQPPDVADRATNLSGVRSAGGGGAYGKRDRKRLEAVALEGLGYNSGPRGDYFTARATVITFSKSESRKPWYTSCPGTSSEPDRDGKPRACSKKVTQDPGTGMWRCEKCNREYDHCIERYMLSMTLADSTSGTWVTAFDREAEVIMGIPARDLAQMEQMDHRQYDQRFKQALFQTRLFKLKARAENAQDEVRVRLQVVETRPVSMVEECRLLLEEIAVLTGEAPPPPPPAPAASSVPPQSYGGGYQAGAGAGMGGGGMYTGGGGGGQWGHQAAPPAAAGGGYGHPQPQYGQPQQQQQRWGGGPGGGGGGGYQAPGGGGGGGGGMGYQPQQQQWGAAGYGEQRW